MKKIGITGNLGSGKTTVSKVFSQLGVPIYNADESAKWLMLHDATLVESIKLLFGSEAYLQDKSLNRQHISKIAFSNEEVIIKLNALVHPKVFKHFDDWCRNQKNADYVLKEAALLVESKSYLDLDKLIVVVANDETLIKRGMSRDNATEEQIKSRLSNQMPQTEKIKFADYVINNNDDVAIIPQVMEIHNKILTLTT